MTQMRITHSKLFKEWQCLTTQHMSFPEWLARKGYTVTVEPLPKLPEMTYSSA